MVLLLLACVGAAEPPAGPPAAPPPVPGPGDGVGPDAPRASAPRGLPPVPKHPLAHRVAERAGDPYREPGLLFTFVVGDRPVRTHRWDIPGGKVEVTWTGPEGTCTVVTTVPYAGDDPLQQEAWAGFVNDQYWLLAPAKVLDPGVILGGEGDTLTLTFAGVGLTPGDRYTLTVDPATGDVTAWSFTLQSGRTGSYAWSPTVPVGGLRLSLERTASDRTIRFTDVRSEAVTLGPPGGACR